MTEERKATFWKDEDGNYKDGVKLLGWSMLMIGIFCLVMGIVTGILAIGDYYEVKAFNRIHETDYTFGEWFWAQYTIKDYHLGTVENKNYQVDLNINKDYDTEIK